MNYFQNTATEVQQFIRAKLSGLSDGQLRATVSEWESLSAPRKAFTSLNPFGVESKSLNKAQVALWMLEERAALDWQCRG